MGDFLCQAEIVPDETATSDGVTDVSYLTMGRKSDRGSIAIGVPVSIWSIPKIQATDVAEASMRRRSFNGQWVRDHKTDSC